MLPEDVLLWRPASRNFFADRLPQLGAEAAEDANAAELAFWRSRTAAQKRIADAGVEPSPDAARMAAIAG